MKKILLILFCLIPFCSIAQDTLFVPKMSIDSATGKYLYKSIENAPGIKKDQLFVKANEWVALNFKSAKNVIQMADKEAGKIIVKGVVEKTLTYKMLGKTYVPYFLHFTLNLTLKDERYRMVIDGFSAENAPPSTTIYNNEITPALADVVYKYNKKHRKNSDDDDDLSLFSSKKQVALFNSQYLTGLDSFAKVTFAEFQKYVTKPGKDDF